LGDVILNAFSKIKKPDERFVEIKENIDKIEENLQTIERLYFKIIRRQSGIITLLFRSSYRILILNFFPYVY
jgi:sorting nexin-4